MLKIKDKEFIPFLTEEKIKSRVQDLGRQISKDYQDKNPLVLGVLNGVFMFFSDLMKETDVSLEVSFVKVASYESTSSTGKVNDLIGLVEDIVGRHVIIIEDIVDTGLSMSHLLKLVSSKSPKSIAIVSLLLKPEALQQPIEVDYVGFEIPNKFVVGYGLDYDGEGRNLKEIYQLK
ncbi:hypoxanthine phosphoribosyltransferase [Echinicola sp. 20G]|uniref:hypoxanthine phosphoribosyltransferase n=1 Tax=Echinicola sp. 20G TaxID=2781961 RepID=UPI001910E001|nr:hypoxanthine phosphoribosyltransferase [Echinicola sp. 20G]